MVAVVGNSEIFNGCECVVFQPAVLTAIFFNFAHYYYRVFVPTIEETFLIDKTSIDEFYLRWFTGKWKLPSTELIISLRQ